MNDFDKDVKKLSEDMQKFAHEESEPEETKEDDEESDEAPQIVNEA